jgi:putative transposase
LVAAAIRTIFALPTGAEVCEQVDKVAAMLAPKFPAVATMLTAFASFPPATGPRCGAPIRWSGSTRRSSAGRTWSGSSLMTPPCSDSPALIEVHDEWQVAERRYLSEGSMAKLTQTRDDDRRPKEVKRATAELVAT